MKKGAVTIDGPVVVREDARPDAARLVPEGLLEVPVPNTAVALLAPATTGAELTLNQRVAMAERLNQVRDSLPRYVRKEKLFDGVRPRANLELGTTSSAGQGSTDAAQTNSTTQEYDMSTAATAVKATGKTNGIGHISQELRKQMKVVGDGAIKMGQRILAEKAAKEKAKADAKAAKLSKTAKKATKKTATPGDKADKPSAKAPKAPKATKVRGIGTIVREALKAKKSTEECIALVKKEFPKAKTTPASVAWYRNDLRERGELPKAK